MLCTGRQVAKVLHRHASSHRKPSGLRSFADLLAICIPPSFLGSAALSTNLGMGQQGVGGAQLWFPHRVARCTPRPAATGGPAAVESRGCCFPMYSTPSVHACMRAFAIRQDPGPWSPACCEPVPPVRAAPRCHGPAPVAIVAEGGGLVDCAPLLDSVTKQTEGNLAGRVGGWVGGVVVGIQ